MTLKTAISWGYLELIETFFKANNLTATFTSRYESSLTPQIDIQYDENSDTGYQITIMSLRHLGPENMLCDYLIKCDVPANRISVGTITVRRDMKKLDEEWMEHRKQLGFR